jgi:hypothetical protein
MNAPTLENEQQVADPTADNNNQVETKKEKKDELATKDRKTPGANVQMTILPADFEPGPHDVLCGRGRQCRSWQGVRSQREREDVWTNCFV